MGDFFSVYKLCSHDFSSSIGINIAFKLSHFSDGLTQKSDPGYET
ncbi:hypothetical protein NEIFL0001_2089 [Neisseria flavescens SK114]|nr:hypothetical protein NEIFL0001_2089 [Neisseria flavescens SK114]